ncbi:MAG: hypothetical protein J2P31_16155, partial [Blastocatellia bacterium]|nr:hypothetical protein [Blastocatellia bacterium]
MIDQLQRIARVFLSATAVLLLLSLTTPNGDLAQGDINFRLLNVERRLDQMQQRVDILERTMQNQALNNRQPTDLNPTVTANAMLELQRKQLSLDQQQLVLEKRLLEMQKTIDTLREGKQETKESKGTNKETPKSEAKPKAPQG